MAVCGILPAAPAADTVKPRSPERMELATQAGLRYIVSRQQADGSFACDKYPAAVTGLACLALLSNRDDRLPASHEDALQRGIRYLLQQQAPNGMVGISMYEHAIAALAVLQRLGMGAPDDDPRLNAFGAKALELTLNAQAVTRSRRNAGGWTYDATDPESDLSNTSWQLLLLYSARQCGYAIDPLHFRNAREYVDRCAQKDGYGYTPPYTKRSGKSYRSLTGVALFLKEILDPGSMEQEPDVVRWLTDVRPSWGGSQYRGYYFCSAFYLTQGIFQIGGDLWDTYYDRVVAILLERQESDGHWPFPPDNLEESRKAGEVYATAMGVLLLSLEKQYLPIYQQQRTLNR